MQIKGIVDTPYFFDGKNLRGNGIECGKKLLGDLCGVFADEESFIKMDPLQVVYRVSSLLREPEGTSGGIYIGVTYIQPGKVGREYFMTRGHFHKNHNSAECYWGVEGEGVLILMDESRNVWAERMHPGTLHYIPARVAHRVANVGDSELVFAASWPSDAGHDYETISREGFACSLLEVDGQPKLV